MQNSILKNQILRKDSKVFGFRKKKQQACLICPLNACGIWTNLIIFVRFLVLKFLRQASGDCLAPPPQHSKLVAGSGPSSCVLIETISSNRAIDTVRPNGSVKIRLRFGLRLGQQFLEFKLNYNAESQCVTLRGEFRHFI